MMFDNTHQPTIENSLSILDSSGSSSSIPVTMGNRRGSYFFMGQSFTREKDIQFQKFGGLFSEQHDSEQAEEENLYRNSKTIQRTKTGKAYQNRESKATSKRPSTVSIAFLKAKLSRVN